MVELSAECELLALSVSHSEVEFLLDKRIELVDKMEKDLSLLKGSLEALKELIPKACADQKEQSAKLAVIDAVGSEMEEYQEVLAQIIRDELIVRGDQIACEETLNTIKAWSMALSESARKQSEETRTESTLAAFALMMLIASLGSILAVIITRGITRPLTRSHSRPISSR